jgi:hypothetical protein
MITAGISDFRYSGYNAVREGTITFRLISVPHILGEFTPKAVCPAKGCRISPLPRGMNISEGCKVFITVPL